jgi:hypothetical protein
MRWPSEWKGTTWVWLGLGLLGLVALWWLLLSLAIAMSPESTTSIIIFGLLVSVIPLCAGVYSLWRGRCVEKFHAAQLRLAKKGTSVEKSEAKIRDQVCAGLRAIDVEAHLAKRGRAEEKTGHGSLGLIEVSGGPIGWINVRKVSKPDGGTSYITDYGIPDRRLKPDSSEIRVSSAHTRTFLLWGRVINLRWKGDDFGSGIVARLNSDVFIKESVLSTADVAISAHGRYGCWTISSATFAVPSTEIWNCYQTIAQHLLESQSSDLPL